VPAFFFFFCTFERRNDRGGGDDVRTKRRRTVRGLLLLALSSNYVFRSRFFALDGISVSAYNLKRDITLLFRYTRAPKVFRSLASVLRVSTYAERFIIRVKKTSRPRTRARFRSKTAGRRNPISLVVVGRTVARKSDRPCAQRGALGSTTCLCDDVYNTNSYRVSVKNIKSTGLNNVQSRVLYGNVREKQTKTVDVRFWTPSVQIWLFMIIKVLFESIMFVFTTTVLTSRNHLRYDALMYFSIPVHQYLVIVSERSGSLQTFRRF